MPRPRRPPERVDDALQHVLQRIDPERRLQLFRIWNAEVGATVAARAQPVGFRDGVLSVRVNSATWMQELQFAKEEIRERLNLRLDNDLVRDIYFVSGGGESAAKQPAVAPRTVEDAAPVELPPIRDPKLAEVFARIASAHRRRSRA